MLAAAGLTAMAVAPRQVQGIPHEKGGCSVQKAPKSRVEYVDWVNWDEIQNWAGDPNGEKKTALVIDFQDGKDERALVYGYRWNGKATGEDLVRAVAAQSSALTVMIQYTGTMGSTLNAVGISAGREELDFLKYDFDRAAIGGEVSFGFFEPNTSMGQEAAPGFEAEHMCASAIERAKETGIIEHPLNAFLYGYPAYDYDYWQLEEGYAEASDYRWQSGWYEGYWSYWHGPNDYDFLGYSGLGMSSTELVDGYVQAWKYTPLNGGDGFGTTGGELAYDLDYYIEDYSEAMHEAPAVEQPVDLEKVKFWVGEGEKSATVVFQFNDGKGPENLVYGYRWSGGWDDNLQTVIANIAKADPRLTATGSDKNRKIEFDSDCNGSFGDKTDHSGLEGEWRCYVKRTVDDRFNRVSDQRWLNPNAVMVVSCQSEDETSVSLPYLLFRPALGSDQIITIPESMDYALADEAFVVPMFIQYPEGGKVNTGFSWTKPSIVSAMTTSNFMGKATAYKNFTAQTATLKVRGSYTAPGETKATTLYSNDCSVEFKAPLRPVTEMYFEQAEVESGLAQAVENNLVFIPADATYTKVALKSSNTRVASVNNTTLKASTTRTGGEAVITATYDYDNSITAEYKLSSALVNPVTDVTFDCVDEDGYITLTPKEMAGLIAHVVPENADIPQVDIAVSENGSGKDNYIATAYKVQYWADGVNTPFYELSGHRIGECVLTVKASDGGGFEKIIPVRVVDREREAEIDYTAGTIMLNEEWYGHTNGGLNYYTPDFEIVYQAYERENPGMSFGCTSQYGLIYGDKLIVSSKQAVDGGDPLPGGGRLVVADARTLKRLGSIDELMWGDETRSGDGRALCGAGPGRVYMGTHSGIYIVDIESMTILGKVGSEILDGDDDGKPNTDPSGSLYNGQVGDMVLAGTHVFVIQQDTGVFIIDTATDNIVKTINDKNVQGITQGSDGNVWYATIEGKQSNFVCLDFKTFEEIDRIAIPAEIGTVSCGWGAWRTTQFTASKKSPYLFFAPGASISNGGSGVYYSCNTETGEIKKIIDITGLDAYTPGIKQGAYGTIRYDDRTGVLVVGTTEIKASGHYRFNWTHFVDASTGEIVKTVALRPYYWFQSMPIFPDVCDPEIDDVQMFLEDEPVTIAFSDDDNIDANIRVTLEPESRSGEDVADIEIDGHRLTVTPKALGAKTYRLSVESNGRVVSRDFTVAIPTVSGISDPESVFDIYAEDGNIVAVGLEGVKVSVCDASGRMVDSFVPDSVHYSRRAAYPAGVYIVTMSNGKSRKLIIK